MSDIDVTITPSNTIEVEYSGAAGIYTVSDVAYDATTWNANTDAASKNAIRDKIESMSGGDVSTSGTPVDNDFAKFVDGTDIEGRSYAEVRTDLNVADGATANSADATLLARANHTGTQVASTISDFDTEVANNTAVDLNTDKVTNATHTGDVTGAGTLTIGADKVNDTHIDWGVGSNQVSAVDLVIADSGTIIAATEVEGALQENRTAVNLNTSKVTNATHTGDVTGDGVLTIGSAKVTETMQVLADNTTQDVSTAKHGYVPKGTNTGTKFLRDDATWDTPAGGGDVSTSGTPVDNDFAKFVDGTDIEGRSYAEVRTDLNVADGATANSADATLLARANHTGTQVASTISDFDTEVSNNTDVAANTTHKTSSGVDHTYIGQSVVATASPGFTKVTVGIAASATGEIDIKGTTSGTVTLKVGDAAGTYDLTLPTDNGDANQALITDGSGATSWATPSTVDDTAYNATSWNDNNDAATKNSIRDKVETMDTAIGLNTAKNTNVPTALSLGTVNGTTVSITSDSGADDVTLPAATTTDAGMLTASLFDEIDANTAKVTNATHTGEVTGSTTLTIANKTGADTGICTGTKGTSGDLAEWNADGDIVDGPTPPTGTILGTTDTQTLTNKTITKRVQTAATAATLSVNSDSYDIAQVTAQTGACTIAAPTGTPTNGRMLLYKIQDNGTTRALTWNAIFVVLSNTTLPATTTINKWHYILTIYDTTDSKYHVLSADVEG